MSVKNIFICLLSITILFYGCKKKEEKPLTANLTAGYQVDPNAFIGSFIVTTETVNANYSFYTGQNAYVRFYQNPTISPYIFQDNRRNVGSVSVNGYSLTNEAAPFYWLPDAPSSLNLSVDSWSITGGSGIPSFNYTNYSPFPGGLDYNIIPDSISKSAGCSFTIANISNMSSGTMIIHDGGANQITYTLSLGQNVINLTPAQLSAFNTGTTGAIIFELKNELTSKISDQNFYFVKETNETKKLKIKP